MCLRQGERQFAFWNLRRNGLSNTAIADHFTVSRPAISKGLRTMDRKVGDLLGVLVWRSVPLGVDAVIFVSETHGIQVWYEHEGDCTGCPRHDECMLFLSDFVREMNITLPENRNPTEVADEIFRTVKE